MMKKWFVNAFMIQCLMMRSHEIYPVIFRSDWEGKSCSRKFLRRRSLTQASKVLQKRHWIENLFWKAGTKMNTFSWHGSWKGFERLSLPNHSSTQAPMSHRTLSKVALSLSLVTCLTSSTLRTAAVYVTTSLYDFHERQAGLLEVAGNAGIQADIQESMWDEVAPLMFCRYPFLFPRSSLSLTSTSFNSSQFTCMSASSTRWLLCPSIIEALF